MPDAVPVEFREKRRILYSPSLDRRRREVASALVREGRLAESLEYLEKTRDEGLLAEVRRLAVSAGDVFTLLRACQILKAEPDPPEWRALAECAERAERYCDAVNAWERAGDPAKGEEVRALRCPDFRPFKPAGK